MVQAPRLISVGKLRACRRYPLSLEKVKCKPEARQKIHESSQIDSPLLVSLFASRMHLAWYMWQILENGGTK
jgi:hypothetical protein